MITNIKITCTILHFPQAPCPFFFLNNFIPFPSTESGSG